MMNESKPLPLIQRLTTCIAFLRGRVWDICNRTARSIVNLFHSLSRPQRIVLKAIVTVCLAFLVCYSWDHPLPSLLFPHGERTIDSWLPLGMLLLASVLSLLVELSGKK